MITITKRLENKYFVDSLKEERILNCEDGYRLVTITVRNCVKSEGVKLSELLIELYSEEVTMYLYDYEYYDVHEEFFEFQVCVDDEMIKEFNKLYSEFKNSAKELLIEEEEKMLNANEEELTLKKTAKEVQDVLEEGIAIVYFWKEENNWKHSEFWYEDPTNETFSLEDNAIIDLILEKDKFAISLDGYNCFADYNLEYIEWRIKKAYEENKERILNKTEEVEIDRIEEIKVNEIEKETFLESEIKFWNDEVEEDQKEDRENIVKGVLYNTSTEQNKKEAKYKIDQILYNHGDMANNSGWYKITNVTIDKFGIFYDVKEIGGNRKNTYHEVFINDHDNNNGSTRVVTMEARIKSTNESYVYNQVNTLLAKDHDERLEAIEDQENEKKEIVDNLIETCWSGIKIEKEIKIYFNRLAKDQRRKIINKFQIDKKDLDINLFYYNTFLSEDYCNLSELKELRSKIVKYLDFLDNFKNSVIEEVNNYEEQIKNFKKEKEPKFYNNTFKVLKDEDFKIVKLDDKTRFGNGNLVYIDEYTLYHKDLGYASMDDKTPYIPEGGRCAIKAIIDEKIIDSIPHWIKSSTFKYTYRSRGFSPSCQPMNGLINHENQKGYKFEVITYNRKLTCKEISDFELIDLNE